MSQHQIIRIDPRLAWLARASARHMLVEAGELELGEAFDGLITALAAIMPADPPARGRRRP